MAEANINAERKLGIAQGEAHHYPQVADLPLHLWPESYLISDLMKLITLND